MEKFEKLRREKYEKLQQLRSVERAIEAARFELRRFWREYIEGNPDLTDEQKEILRREFEEFEKSYLEGLEKQKMSLEQELENLGLSEEDIKRLRRESRRRLKDFLALYRSIIREQETALDSARKLRNAKQDPEVENVADIFLNYLESSNNGLKGTLEELVRKTPEAFLAYHLLRLKEYKKALEKGEIIQTPWVEEMKRKTIDFLAQTRAVFLWGETGSGKTEFAKLVSQQYSEGYEIVRGHRFMTREDLLGYLGLTATEPPPAEKVPQLVKDALERLKQISPDLSEEEMEQSREIIEQTIIGQASDPVTITEFFWGPVYRAMKEGKVLIIDEANYIPPGLMASLNSIIANYRPGMKFTIPETGEEIGIKEGFAIILTGNLNVGEKGKYTERYRLDPALRDRVKLVEYNTPPQEYRPEVSVWESANRDLFMIAISELIDKNGNLILPDGEANLEKIWRLCQAFKLFQEIFAGKPIEEAYQFTQQGRSLSIRITENNLSMRKLLNILDRWKKEGFSKSLDYYIWDEVIAQALDTPKEAAYFYQVFQKIYGFFQSEEWDQNPDYGERGEVWFNYRHPLKIDREIPPEQKNLLPVSVIKLVEAVSGERVPEIEIFTTEGDKKQEEIQNNIEFFEKEWLLSKTEFDQRSKELEEYCPPEQQ